MLCKREQRSAATQSEVIEMRTFLTLCLVLASLLPASA